MSNEGKAAILQTAAKMLAFDLYEAAEYGRTRARISVEGFDGELRSALRRWDAIRRNLKAKKGTIP